MQNIVFCEVKILVVKSTMFAHCNIHKYTWTSRDGKMHNQIDYRWIGRRWHSSTRDLRSFRGADCDIDHCVVVTEVRERLAVSKQAAQKFDVERFNFRKLNELEVRTQYQIQFSNWFPALENLNDREDINRAWKNIKENIKISAKDSLGLYEWKQHKPWFDEECLRFLDQRKQAKMQWLQDANQNKAM